ncbi:HEAT repeat domain-containing protein, partial [Aetokthonos hydrillicola]|uniref:HEAT repeat domain-containing protein n=1 Tax=Aetokthonos hydrillicola TaxID=1550245 RepID=UPI001ABBA8B4
MVNILGEDNPDFRDYLQSICENDIYKCWEDWYISSDALDHRRTEDKKILPQRFSFDLQVQTLQPRKQLGQTPEEQEEKVEIERLSVLVGLRKYAKDHVLLVGQPGSGKSTALERLLWEEAEKGIKIVDDEGKWKDENFKIPVLVELRCYRTSVLDLIRDFLLQHNLSLEIKQIENLLLAQKFLLLIDGLNELPNEDARLDLNRFRQTYCRYTPMIFTTRDLGVGGDLDIEKKLEMQPLTPEQMQQFVRVYLPEQGEEMLQRLGERLQDFGKTPLLLWMLCSVFTQAGDIPANLGLVFRCFTESYNKKFWDKVKVSDEFRHWVSELLAHLAFAMIQGEEPTELQVTIDRQVAEKLLEEFLQGKVDNPPTQAKKWLEDLLKHHLIQRAGYEQVEFRHQLLQEYYAAEKLCQLLPSFSAEDLKWKYLNYLKWTEPLALMMELVKNQAQAEQVVKLALQVDWQLGARLAGSVNRDWQEKTINLLVNLRLPLLVKNLLLAKTKSPQAVPGLIQLLQDPEWNVRYSAADALGKIGDKSAIPGLIQLLEHPAWNVRERAADALGKIGDKSAIPGLIQLLEHPEWDVRYRAADALGKIGDKSAIPGLIQLLQDPEWDMRYRAADALGKIGDKSAIPGLIQLLEHPESRVRYSAA